MRSIAAGFKPAVNFSIMEESKSTNNDFEFTYQKTKMKFPNIKINAAPFTVRSPFLEPTYNIDGLFPEKPEMANGYVDPTDYIPEDDLD